ncbi:TlpA disulfide reductase family protein [Pinibacter aurantiacus]|uniref:Redoxin domain-containing protein n=1 Tax=Pinibacter aurantiacus TaxID=2851599 RepID=A0A9E2SER1_9BACT|nr:TlpA disulfide reductase family protein [Pinibacter aurantiacus]MBV4360399.1 redoxin domain-containing protein [Pinibacter aurantiacus]
MKKKFINILPAFGLFILTTQGNAYAQTAKQETVVAAKDIPALKAAIEANPNSLEAHEAYFKAINFGKLSEGEQKEVVLQYEDWMKKFPTSAAVPYALGHAYANMESPKAKPYLLKATEIDPKFDKAYFDLWIDGERWGDFKLSREYLAKAAKADPKNADYAFYYANGFADGDFKKYKEMNLQVAKDFPGTNRGGQALYWLAYHATDPKEKIAIFEQLKRDFPADKNNWSASGMSAYYDFLLGTDPAKALTLAESMSAIQEANSQGKKMWDQNVVVTKSIVQANEFLAKGNGTEALAVLKNVPAPVRGLEKEDMVLLKAKAMDASGKSQDAYQYVLLRTAKEPTAKLQQGLANYGNKLNKSKTVVNNDVQFVRDTAGKQAPNFTLENYFTGSNSSLSDYKGKVVLLTYWFPGCGPCRGEFPHFENVVKKFKKRNDFVYLAINIAPEQDDYVLPFVKSSGYSFTPLKDNKNWQKGVLDNRGAAPTNFLIDQNGKIIFFNFRTDEKNEQSLEMMINSMLEKKSA